MEVVESSRVLAVEGVHAVSSTDWKLSSRVEYLPSKEFMLFLRLTGSCRVESSTCRRQSQLSALDTDVPVGDSDCRFCTESTPEKGKPL